MGAVKVHLTNPLMWRVQEPLNQKVIKPVSKYKAVSATTRAVCLTTKKIENGVAGAGELVDKTLGFSGVSAADTVLKLLEKMLDLGMEIQEAISATGNIPGLEWVAGANAYIMNTLAICKMLKGLNAFKDNVVSAKNFFSAKKIIPTFLGTGKNLTDMFKGLIAFHKFLMIIKAVPSVGSVAASAASGCAAGATAVGALFVTALQVYHIAMLVPDFIKARKKANFWKAVPTEEKVKDRLDHLRGRVTILRASLAENQLQTWKNEQTSLQNDIANCTNLFKEFHLKQKLKRAKAEEKRWDALTKNSDKLKAYNEPLLKKVGKLEGSIYFDQKTNQMIRKVGKIEKWENMQEHLQDEGETASKIATFWMNNHKKWVGKQQCIGMKMGKYGVVAIGQLALAAVSTTSLVLTATTGIGGVTLPLVLAGGGLLTTGVAVSASIFEFSLNKWIEPALCGKGGHWVMDPSEIKALKEAALETDGDMEEGEFTDAASTQRSRTASTASDSTEYEDMGEDDTDAVPMTKMNPPRAWQVGATQTKTWQIGARLGGATAA